MDGLKQLTDNLRARLGELSFNQKALLGVVAVAGVISVAVFSLWLQKEDNAVLYSNLTPEDAAAALEELARQDVPTELRNGGGTILVPESMVARLRIELAGKGVVANGPVGFEIFDGKQYGLTEFLQNVNFKRALEGELTKTIEGFPAIQSARVHLVLPQPSIFKKNEQGATASVVLRLGRGGRLNESQISGIQALVAGSVEDLAVENVTVIDQTGKVLSAAVADEETGRGETQLGLRKEVEEYLTDKAGSMLDKVLGPGRSIVRVDATLNFEKLTREREIYDPATTVVRSEVRNEENDPSTGATSENSTTNYEINRTVEHIVGQTGNIAALSVSVFVDGHYEPAADGKGEPTYKPLTEDEIGQLRRVVQTAVGLNPVRGDQIEIVNMQFRQMEEPTGASPLTDWMGVVTEYGGKVLLVVLLAVVALSLRRTLGRLVAGGAPAGAVAATAAGRAGGPGRGGPPAAAEDQEHFDGIPELNDQVMGDIRDYAADNPDRVAEVIQSWIREIDLSGNTRETVGN
ncbi:MAG: flagellar M-ring protein FliF [bacterium]|nr:flagellar M-ring protein FliF [bacterium]